MHQVLRDYINKHLDHPLTDEAFEPIGTAFTFKKYRKKQYLLQEGDVCKHLSFILKGAMRQYTVDQKGNEHILRFGIENWWMMDRESFEMETPSLYNIEAWEDAELLQIRRDHAVKLYENSAAFRKMTQELDKRGQIANQKRIHGAISLTAEERYLELLKSHPVFFQRFPQNMIASYLGISAETLSRIRKNALSK
jgi:CRP/FNR family transcriptional regulator, anaerobic regulatory protein